jgi:hypothetical protein
MFVAVDFVSEKEDGNPEKTVLGSSPDENGFSSSKTKQDRTVVQRMKLFVLAILQELIVLRSRLRKDIGFRNNFSYDNQRAVLNNQANEKISGNKD